MTENTLKTLVKLEESEIADLMKYEVKLEPIEVKTEAIMTMTEQNNELSNLNIEVKEESEESLRSRIKLMQNKILNNLVPKDSAPAYKKPPKGFPITFDIKSEKYKKKLIPLKKYLPNLERALEKEQAAIRLILAAKVSIKKNKEIPRKILVDLKLFDEFNGPNHQILIPDEEAKMDVDEDNVKEKIRKLQGALKSHNAKKKHLGEMRSVLKETKGWKANLQYLLDIEEELENLS